MFYIFKFPESSHQFPPLDSQDLIIISLLGLFKKSLSFFQAFFDLTVILVVFRSSLVVSNSWRKRTQGQDQLCLLMKSSLKKNPSTSDGTSQRYWIRGLLEDRQSSHYGDKARKKNIPTRVENQTVHTVLAALTSALMKNRYRRWQNYIWNVISL